MAGKRLDGRSDTGASILLILLGLLVPSDIREDMIGDLTEEYHRKSVSSAQLARKWLWKEVMRSVPGLLRMRSRSSALRAVAMSSGVTLAACVALFVWDMLVVRAIVASLGRETLPLLTATLQVMGVTVIATMVARWTFRTERTFGRNFCALLLPLLLVILLPSLIVSLTMSGAYLSSVRFFWLVAAGLGIIVGGFAGNQIRRSPASS